MTANIKEQLRQIQGKVIRLDFTKQDFIESTFNEIKSFVTLLPKAFSEKGYPDDIAKNMAIEFIKNIAVCKADLANINTFGDAKKNISLAILDLQKELEP